ncbi:hypothetical protein GCM10011385_37340 [Nitratireductor aestuarii]|uniref:Tripartite tricarboxylate transporter substrate binding protein n=1 Tax=Nitratireductor aestuarii TaxID=1735103 RepID=A0A916S0X4_9HYPH|nr:tripartite tricarboxylate transporter substrate binding protein [Nitratireductor aestuarii]GGA79647.1 hypothetical protein GCM10011385_37340 [Nitratireductor aestuarii]
MTLSSITRRAAIALGSATVATALMFGSASAQDKYPSRDITFIVPYAPGASGDLLARKYVGLLSKILNVTVVVSNVPGGSGTIGTVEIFGAAPDGYTIGYGHNSPLAIAPHKNAQLPFKNVEDFTAIGGFGHQATTVTVKADAKWQNFAEFFEDAKAKPGELSIAVGGAGNVKDMQLQQLEKAADVDFNIVPFSGGGAEAVVSVMGGITDAVAVNASSVRGQIESGDLRPLAVIAESSEKEIDGFEVVNPQSYPGMKFLPDSSGIVGPKGMPAEIVVVLEKAHFQILEDEDFKNMLISDSYIIEPTGAEAYHQQLLKDYANFGEIYGK